VFKIARQYSQLGLAEEARSPGNVVQTLLEHQPGGVFQRVFIRCHLDRQTGIMLAAQKGGEDVRLAGQRIEVTRQIFLCEFLAVEGAGRCIENVEPFHLLVPIG